MASKATGRAKSFFFAAGKAWTEAIGKFRHGELYQYTKQVYLAVIENGVYSSLHILTLSLPDISSARNLPVGQKASFLATAESRLSLMHASPQLQELMMREVKNIFLQVTGMLFGTRL
jgi:hypothetical protein